MNVLCKLFGHQPPVYAKHGWWSPGEEYAFSVSPPVFDYVGGGHCVVKAKCPRCGTTYRLCRIHMPKPEVKGKIVRLSMENIKGLFKALPSFSLEP